MATVRISQALFAETENQILTMQQTELNTVQQITEEDKKGVVPFIDDKVWPAGLKEKIPQDWMGTIRIMALHLYGKNNKHDRTIELGSTDDIVYVPHHMSAYSQSYRVYPHDLERFPELKLLVDKYIAVEKTEAEIREKWRNSKIKIHDFLRSQPSLNVAATVWPGILLYVSRSTKDHLEVKKDRKPRIRKEHSNETEEPPTHDVDFDNLTAMAAASQLTKGSE
jgi:hypothetical protein